MIGALLCVLGLALTLSCAQLMVTVDTTAPGQHWPHVWEECVGSGHAALALRADWRASLAMAAKTLGFKRVRFHGVFDDDMNVVLPTGTSFWNVFAVYDYIVSLGMAPYVELGFTPELLATSNATIMHYKGNISPPHEAAWVQLVQDFGKALLKRYGPQEVGQWFFEVYNEYNCGFLSAPDPKEAYYRLYNASQFALKSVWTGFKVGGPVTCQSADLPDFLAYVQENKLAADFVSTHIYPTDPAVNNGHIGPILAASRAQVPATLPLFYSEFNDGLFSDPPLHDQPFAAAAIVSTMTEVHDYTNGTVALMSWWTFSDIFEEQGMPAQEFDKPTGTGWGLLSASGIPKPVFRAFELLHHSGNTRLATNVGGSPGDVGVLATQGADTMVFLWNHRWPTAPGFPGMASNVTLQIHGPVATTKWTYTRIDADHANAPQAWRNDGSPLYLTAADVERYRAVSQLQWTSATCTQVQGNVCVFPAAIVPPQGLLVFRSVA